MKQSHETYAAFDLDALPVTKLSKLLRQLGERGDFCRVPKAKQIVLVEEHSIEEQALALLNIGIDPVELRLADGTPDADSAIQALIAGESRGRLAAAAPPPEADDDTDQDTRPERAAPLPPPKPPMRKARAKRTPEAIQAAAPTSAPPPAPDVPVTAVPEESLLAFERQAQAQDDLYGPVMEDSAELEQAALLLAKVLIAGRRAIDRELIKEVVRSELARAPHAWSDSD